MVVKTRKNEYIRYRRLKGTKVEGDFVQAAENNQFECISSLDHVKFLINVRLVLPEQFPVSKWIEWKTWTRYD